MTQMELIRDTAVVVRNFEALWSRYIAKLQRVDDLRQQGRYGFQLRMPKKSVALAKRDLDDFCLAHGIGATP